MARRPLGEPNDFGHDTIGRCVAILDKPFKERNHLSQAALTHRLARAFASLAQRRRHPAQKALVGNKLTWLALVVRILGLHENQRIDRLLEPATADRLIGHRTHLIESTMNQL
ncbi:MAG: hypothetical protein MJE77_07250 [Proteobacteria bacterium]|nr:hypothetical protein [Pseudomonadota bacterium]